MFGVRLKELRLEKKLTQDDLGRFDGAPLDDQDKEDLLDFLRIIWNRKKNK